MEKKAQLPFGKCVWLSSSEQLNDQQQHSSIWNVLFSIMSFSGNTNKPRYQNFLACSLTCLSWRRFCQTVTTVSHQNSFLCSFLPAETDFSQWMLSVHPLTDLFVCVLCIHVITVLFWVWINSGICKNPYFEVNFIVWLLSFYTTVSTRADFLNTGKLTKNVIDFCLTASRRVCFLFCFFYWCVTCDITATLKPGTSRKQLGF